ncbi:MAG: AbrB/MazE/SpoVT family DNA-binding domain-containing protein [Euryarchaeota archaeon]|nr:AbrB/MazE/SpoVT family DNA-binding domain-containing protein [Euryarchaeota archaeon]MBU4607398.1 AbrB/MazE/SpoVT family DNA-binding domain-containing protein [Euryarchaeota archaeon]MBV1729175.1 AbrB/MazE/SpoVT family DNA-binding domain-containing protein [Methanobacterium sp.]MBV1755887.1 AbrB/MazE/SpoVT family DNA-binding domain-containing protein [Methanobacterium sp.]
MVLLITSETKISKGFQTVVPAHIRKKFDVGPGGILEWKPTEKGAEIKFRKKVTIDDIYGICDGPKTDAVALKKKVQRGEKL